LKIEIRTKESPNRRTPEATVKGATGMRAAWKQIGLAPNPLASEQKVRPSPSSRLRATGPVKLARSKTDRWSTLRSRSKTEATEIETVRMKRLANSILGQDASRRIARDGEISSGRASMGRNGESGADSCVTIFSAPVLREVWIHSYYMARGRTVSFYTRLRSNVPKRYTTLEYLR
jgi:hypothetical protein